MSLNGWGQMVGGLYMWFFHSFGMEMPLHMFQTIYQRGSCLKKKDKDEEPGWYYFCPWGSHKPLVTKSPSSIKQWKESWFWMTGNWQRVDDDPESDLDVPSVYGIANALSRCELSKEIVEGDVPLSRKKKSRASGTGAPHGNVVEIVDNYVACSAPPLQRTLAMNTSGEVVLEGPPKLSQKLGGTERGPYESKRQLREMIGAPGARIPDDVLRNVPFYPSMGA
ncbi:Uncharacterized protein Adt_06842 [Abeliophyllum distichum]|uniref:Uncharacterized protein n=1 Tax=Abeliophyllum distichum TaxID=126358 RepID=A0ABD1V819_9LAMI